MQKLYSSVIADTAMTNNGNLDIGNRVLLEIGMHFCYLVDVLDAREVCNSAVVVRIRCVSKKF